MKFIPKRVLKNLLVQYQGGGYEGCFWEWNYFLFDHEGKFHVIAASGYKGITTRSAALAFLKAGKESYSYRLTNKKELHAFQRENNPTHVAEVVAKVNDIYPKNVMYWVCDECGCRVIDNEVFYSGYHGDGGIGVVGEGKFCADCYCMHTCNDCGEFQSEPMITDGCNYDLCESCAARRDIYPFKVEYTTEPFGMDPRQGLHLDHPTESELENAKQTAYRNGFKVIYVHRLTNDDMRDNKANRAHSA